MIPDQTHGARVPTRAAGMTAGLALMLAAPLGWIRPAPSTAATVATTTTSAAPARHWAFQPVARPEPPGEGHPVDAFVTAALRARGLAASPGATDAELVRRLHFDLLGLPPSPEDLDAYARDTAPDRWERLVDRLLASPHYGERWGRHWLDAVRFTESTGFEYDRLRDHAWHYRDYVIRSFNEDKPYDRFVREQIAGDVLESITRDGLIGPSLLVCGAYDQAGNAQANATQRTLTREEELEDLVGTVGQTFLGLTLNCARCHDHKFDPIPLTEYYRVKSVFDGILHGERPLETPADTVQRRQRQEALRAQLAEVRAELARLEAEGARAATLRRVPGHPEAARPDALPVAIARWEFDRDPASTDPALPGTPLGGATVVRDRLLLPAAGAFFQSRPLDRDLEEKTLEAWVALADLEQRGGAAIAVENAEGTVFDAIVFGEREPGKWMAGSEGFGRTRDLDAPSESAAPGEFVQVAITYRSDRTIAVFRNGQPYGAPYVAQRPLPTFKAGNARVILGRRHLGGGSPWLTGAVRSAALYDRALSPAEIAASFRAAGAGVTAREALAHLDGDAHARHAAAATRARTLAGEIGALDKPAAVAYAGLRGQPAPTRVYKRGDVKSPGDIVEPGAISAIPSLSADLGLAPDAPEAERRRRFADWLVDPRNPLPARVMVNRVWQHHFGQGLVATPNDFGASGARPTHPELLDWLAHRFVEDGWSVKALHRVLCTSAAYRRSAAPRAEALAVDADNALLWRHTPRRLEAEAVRDAMLAASGQLNPALGGPSFRPFTTTDFNATFYHPFDSGDPVYNRRTVYRMNVNSGKDPLLDAFDCPDPSIKTPRRGVTITPLQALGLMNGTFVQRQAEHLADRALATARDRQDLSAAIHAAYRFALGRPATPEEHPRALDAARARGLASVCWALLNSTEFVYVR